MSSVNDEEDRKMPALPPEGVKDEGKKANKRSRLLDQDKKRSAKRKKEIDHKKLWLEYSAFMNANLEKKRNYNESPLFVIRRSLYLIIENSIFLKNPVITSDNSFDRRISYDLERVGDNVKLITKNPKYRNVRIDDIKGRKIFILVNLKYIQNISSLVFFDELGRRMNSETILKQEKAYALLAMVEKTEIDQQNQIFISSDDTKLANKFWVNQIKTDGSFHFETSGKIFGLGYGPKYAIDPETNLSIGQFGGKKKLLSDEESIKQESLKKKISLSAVNQWITYSALLEQHNQTFSKYI